MRLNGAHVHQLPDRETSNIEDEARTLMGPSGASNLISTRDKVGTWMGPSKIEGEMQLCRIRAREQKLENYC